MARPQIFLKHLWGVIVHHSPHLIPKSLLQSKMFPISSLLKPFLTNHSLENFCQFENHYSLGTPSCQCPLKHAALRNFYHIGDGTWNRNLVLGTGIKTRPSASYSCVCPSTSKVPYPSDTGRRLGITNFVWSGYWQRLQIMSGNSLVLRPDSLSGHFFLVEAVEQGLSHEGKLGSAFSWAFWEPWGWLSL